MTTFRKSLYAASGTVGLGSLLLGVITGHPGWFAPALVAASSLGALWVVKRRRQRTFVDAETLKTAMAYGILVASFNVEGFGLDRMLEIVEKYDEDLTDVTRPHAPTKVVIEVGEAIEVSPERERGAAVDPLMAALEQRLQEMLDRLALESPLYEPKRFPA